MTRLPAATMHVGNATVTVPRCAPAGVRPEQFDGTHDEKAVPQHRVGIRYRPVTVPVCRVRKRRDGFGPSFGDAVDRCVDILRRLSTVPDR